MVRRVELSKLPYCTCNKLAGEFEDAYDKPSALHLHFFFLYKNIFYDNIVAEICEIVRAVIGQYVLSHARWNGFFHC